MKPIIINTLQSVRYLDTLHINNAPPGNHQHQSALTAREQEGWSEAQREGGLALLMQGLLQERRICAEMRGEMRRALTELEDMTRDTFVWHEVEEKLLKDYRTSVKLAQNRHRQRMRDLMRKEGIKVPAWLDKSAASVLEQTLPQDQTFSPAEGRVLRSQLSQTFTSTPAKSIQAGSQDQPWHLSPISILIRQERQRVERLQQEAGGVVEELVVEDEGSGSTIVQGEGEGEGDREVDRVVEGEGGGEEGEKSLVMMGGGRRGRLKRKVNRNRWKNKRRRIKLKEIRSNLPDLFTNYSDHVLTPAQISLLNKGPNFVPIRPTVNRTEVEVSNSQWERKMHWREFWFSRELEVGEECGEEEEDRQQPTRVEDRILRDREVKVNMPRGHSAPAELKNCIAATKFEITGAPLNKVRDNLNRELREGMRELQQLQKERKIVIKRSDKAGGLVLMNFTPYKEAGDRKIKETYVDADGQVQPKYKQVSEAVLKRQHKKLLEVTKEGVEKGLICPEDAAIMVPKEPTAGRLYMNPKDHKKLDLVTNMPPMREVVSGSGSNTEGLSKVVTHYINPINRQQPSYLEDTRHILAEVQDINRTLSPLPSTTRLVTIDVVAMYPSIPPREGVLAMRRALQQAGMSVEKVEYLVKVTELVLHSNVFEWDGKLYQQLFGTAIGTPLAPPYSGLYMGELERSAMDEWAVLNPEQSHQLQKFKRMIDDGWGLWTGSVDKLFDFLAFLNNRAPSIKFTMEASCLSNCDRTDDHSCSPVISYLDVSMWVDKEGLIMTDLYRKPNTKCQYLLPDSAHPRHCFPGIVKSLAHRVVRICSRVDDRDRRLEELKQLLLGRGYKPSMLKEVLDAAKRLDREQTLARVDRGQGEDRVRYVVTFDPRLPPIPHILGKTWRTMCDRDRRLKTVFSKPPQASMKKGQNIGDHLLRARLAQEPSVQTRAATGVRQVGVRCCGRGGRRQLCSLCPFLGAASDPRVVVQEATINHTGEVISIIQNITCTDQGCLYLLSCTKNTCRKQYVGETGRSLYVRFKEHKDSAETADTPCPVGQHFQLPGHSTRDMVMVPLELVRGDKATRKQRERNLINTHQMIRFGMNVRL